MNFFHVHAEKEPGEARARRTWFVIAGSLLEAMSLIPEDFSVTAVEVQMGTVAGPGRVIGSMGAATVHQGRGVSLVDRGPEALLLRSCTTNERAGP